MEMLRRVLRGYTGIFKAVGFLLALVGASAGLAFIVAWPLWFFATRQRGAYSIFALALIAAGVLFFSIRGVLRRRVLPRSPAEDRKSPFISALIVLAFLVLLLGGVYSVFLLAFRGLYLAAVPVLIILLLLLGFVAFAAQRKNRAS